MVLLAGLIVAFIKLVVAQHVVSIDDSFFRDLWLLKFLIYFCTCIDRYLLNASTQLTFHWLLWLIILSTLLPLRGTPADHVHAYLVLSDLPGVISALHTRL